MVLFVSWLAKYQEKKLLNITIMLKQEFIKQGKLVFGPTLTLIFLTFGKCEKGKLHILKKVRCH